MEETRTKYDKKLLLNIIYYSLCLSFWGLLAIEGKGNNILPVWLFSLLLSAVMLVGSFVYEMRGHYWWLNTTIEKGKHEEIFFLGIFLMRAAATLFFFITIYLLIKNNYFV